MQGGGPLADAFIRKGFHGNDFFQAGIGGSVFLELLGEDLGLEEQGFRVFRVAGEYSLCGFECAGEVFFPLQNFNLVYVAGKLLIQSGGPAASVVEEDESISYPTGGVHGGQGQKKADRHGYKKGDPPIPEKRYKSNNQTDRQEPDVYVDILGRRE